MTTEPNTPDAAESSRSEHVPDSDTVTPVMEDYLKTIYELQYDRDGAVWTSRIADSLEVTPPTVSSMLEKLERRGLIHREKHRPVTLTETGENVALGVIRNHRLLETFLADYLEYEWDEVHAEADRLEHYVSDQFVDRLTAMLEHPSSDPHGDPIPDEALAAPTRSWIRLSEAEAGVSHRVERVRADGERLRYLADCGITPGVPVEIVERTPLESVEIAIESDPDHEPNSQVLPKRACERILVGPLPGNN
ncbi:metal-dependent transcriptional regulator [Halostagnicola sp. A-GB9-2]|uniref:metal-dependent transcriptional regulator n=1 Tax=Halostagnicola sp. A-GB9-2 TaxID=3048066 RepID=UPI0024BFE879|nr:metal-dependent transcriptional regulator [Halostagnicola sp. A-GB9-2]MDJ1430453.1 metal-dependent transcriptional regulator [Halostagnicola sp. A-GB9-2]